MKTLITILLVLLVSMQGYGQRRGKVDPRDSQIDSLTKVTSSQTTQLDSLSTELDKYLGVYTTLSEKVFQYNFDPEKITFLIDSLRTTRDSTFTSASSILQDSLSLLKNKNMSLQVTLDSLGLGSDPFATLAIQEKEKATAITDLKNLKELLDSGIITQDEFDLKKKKLLEKL
jgi:hypothetical protein